MRELATGQKNKQNERAIEQRKKKCELDDILAVLLDNS